MTTDKVGIVKQHIVMFFEGFVTTLQWIMYACMYTIAACLVVAFSPLLVIWIVGAALYDITLGDYVGDHED